DAAKALSSAMPRGRATARRRRSSRRRPPQASMAAAKTRAASGPAQASPAPAPATLASQTAWKPTTLPKVSQAPFTSGHLGCGQVLRTPVARARQQQVHVADRALHEAALAVAQVELPHADEAFVVTLAAHFVELVHETLAPVAQRERVAGADVFQVHQAQVAGARRGAGERADAGNEAAGEDEALDEVHRTQRLFVAMVLDGDGLDQGQALWLEQRGALGQVGVEVLVADGFDHFDRHQ